MTTRNRPFDRTGADFATAIRESGTFRPISMSRQSDITDHECQRQCFRIEDQEGSMTCVREPFRVPLSDTNHAIPDETGPRWFFEAHMIWEDREAFGCSIHRRSNGI